MQPARHEQQRDQHAADQRRQPINQSVHDGRLADSRDLAVYIIVKR